MKYLPHFLIISCILFTTSCAQIFFGEAKRATPTEVFEEMWENVNENYPFFEYKGVDWDSVRVKYSAQIDDNMSEKALFDVLAATLNELKDGHVNIYTDFDKSRNWSWFLDYPVSYNYDILQRNYLGTDYKMAGPFKYTILQDSIGYMNYGSFGARYSSKHMNAVFDLVDTTTKGLIVDIRHNGGGSLEGMRNLVGYFADTTRQVANFVFKNKPGREQFLDTIPIEVKPAKRTYTRPVYVLTDHNSYSAATFFPGLVRTFPHVKTMGSTSGGGGGVPRVYELRNGWKYRFSATVTLDMDGFNIENGVPADIPVPDDALDLKNGRDIVLERAIDTIAALPYKVYPPKKKKEEEGKKGKKKKKD